MIQEVIYNNKFKGKGHECRNLVIRCMDFRFSPYTKELLDKMFADEGGFGDYDSPGVGGGGSKSIIDEESRAVVFSALNIAEQKHYIKRIVVIDHIDCGAYGGSSQFETPEEEAEFHTLKLEAAGKILKTQYPQLEIILLYQDWESIIIIK